MHSGLMQHFSHCVADCKDLTGPPTLPCQRRQPQLLDTGGSSHTFNTPQSSTFVSKIEFLDTVGGKLKHRFQQDRGMPVAAALEKVYWMQHRKP